MGYLSVAPEALSSSRKSMAKKKKAMKKGKKLAKTKALSFSWGTTQTS
jgi:hypothetical protein